eukprot:TRINITY_DN27272_c0_g1_i7.p2 TRINITY_DN27272_c0_g1~~TRINITY_DN27272_c0_g1_i7.p2  ORF type:complete len:110 (+),score=6.16 TRINITY_DN27272_c0_g1_i7:809-1138(+)
MMLQQFPFEFKHFAPNNKQLVLKKRDKFGFCVVDINNSPLHLQKIEILIHFLKNGMCPDLLQPIKISMHVLSCVGRQLVDASYPSAHFFMQISFTGTLIFTIIIIKLSF